MDMSARYNEMHDKGLAALSSGDVKPFPGPGEVLRHNLIIASSWPLSGPIAQLLEDLLCMEGLNFIHAGVDFPMHATLKQAKAPDNVVWLDEIAMNRLRDCSQVPFDTLILDGANLILAASSVPDELVAMRAELDQELVKYGLEPLPLAILHITLARMVKLPESVGGRRKAFAKYKEAMLIWRDEFAERPVVLDLTHKIRMTSTYELLTDSLLID